METTKSLMILSLAFASVLSGLKANVAESDDAAYWRRRAAESWNHTLDSYEPDPLKIINHLNTHVHRTLKEVGASNATTRRLLSHGYQGPCKATNPIDQCWRCRGDWATNRQRLADCVLGFGHKAKGGKGGRIYVVTDPSDNDMVNPKPGTLRHAIVQKEPLWIIFARDMVINPQQELIMQGDKTIDGRGARVYITNGASFMIQNVRNVIIHNLRIHNIIVKGGSMIRDSVDHFGIRGKSDGDGIQIFGSQDIWIDHVSITKCADGIIDAVQASTGITISNSHFTDHDHVMLFGAGDDYTPDEKMQITLAFNHFGKRLVQRMPRVRYGFIHCVNNDYTHWKMYAIGGTHHPTIISQGNRYIAEDPKAKQVTSRGATPESEWKSWPWVTDGDLFMGGAYFVPSGDQSFYKKHVEKDDHVRPAPAHMVRELTQFAGALTCRVGQPC